jgi:nucleoid-associated protein YgaU
MDWRSHVGLFGKKKPKVDFSNVQAGSSTTDVVPPPAPPLRTYTIKKGDTLSAIAKREYGNAQEWHAIFEANRDIIKDPDKIFPGQIIKLPAKEQAGGAR